MTDNAKIVSFETAALAKKRGFDLYTNVKYNQDGQIVLHDNDTNIFAPEQDVLQKWLESKNMFIAIAPEFYTDGINWNWQVLWRLPENQWGSYTDDDGNTHPMNIASGTGYYGDNGEFPTRHEAIEAALNMALMKLDIYYRHNSVEQLAKLYGTDMNTMLDKIRPLSSQLGDWSFREFTSQQLEIIVKNIGEPTV